MVMCALRQQRISKGQTGGTGADDEVVGVDGFHGFSSRAAITRFGIAGLLDIQGVQGVPGVPDIRGGLWRRKRSHQLHHLTDPRFVDVIRQKRQLRPCLA
jgi:hypothetical protein